MTIPPRPTKIRATALIDVLDNDSDPDGETVFVSAIDGTAVSPGDTVTLGNGATVTLDLTTGKLIYDPNGAFDYLDGPSGPDGSDSFTYTVSDGTLTTDAAVGVTITPVNDAPDGVADDFYTVDEDGTLNVLATGSPEDVLDNDTDVDGTVVSAELYSSPGVGSLTFNSDGSFDYMPAANFNGIDTFQYKAVDDDGAKSAPITVTITVVAQFDAPVANDDDYSVNESDILTVLATGLPEDVLDNDTDVDLDPLTVLSPGTFAVTRPPAAIRLARSRSMPMVRSPTTSKATLKR